jgi:transposase-like protein
MPPYARPTELTLSQEKTPVEGACPACGAHALRAYPVNSEGGWFQVVKCQDCLHSVSREHWALLGPLAMLSDSI